MHQAGVISDMVESSLDSLDQDDVEDLADSEVDAVLFDITKGELGKVGPVKHKPLPNHPEVGQHCTAPH